MKKLLLISLMTGIMSLSSAGITNADTSCQPIYGGGETCVQVGNLSVNKTVKNPSTGAFVDNLNINDPKYSPTSAVDFQITVTNTGSGNISSIEVKDTLPSYVTFVSGPGSFDGNTKVLTFTVNNLGAGQSQTFNVSAKVVDQGSLPADQGVTCVVNQASATSNDNKQSSDNSQFCIEKPTQPAPTTKGGLKVFPAPKVVSTPATGPEMLPLIGLIPSGVLGLFLRKKTSK
ncbi:MAG: DUF11 domain-containing protein [Patescibacteria group bacterium]